MNTPAPQPPPSLDDAWTKLRWAREQFEILRTEIEPFEKRDDHRIDCEVNADAGEYVFYVRSLNSPNPDWGLRIGDCLHNARAALDYLIVRLLIRATGQRPRDVDLVGFPICDSPERFGSAKTATTFRKHPTLSGYLTRIEELQPFNVSNPSVWGTEPNGNAVVSPLPAALERLAELDNVDKHRVIHATWLGVMGGPFVGPEPPAGFEKISGAVDSGPLKDNAEIATFWFKTPLPSEWHPTEVEMKRTFPLHVALDEALPSSSVLEVLSFCLWGVQAVLTLFEPVFAHGAPARTVTTVDEPPPRSWLRW